MNLYIRTGRLIDKRVILRLLEAVPSGDIEHLKSIVVMLKPKGKEERRRYGRGVFLHSDRVRIYVWGIQDSVWNRRESNFFRACFLQFAETLYHEIGHHVDFIRETMKERDDEIKLLRRKKKIFEKKCEEEIAKFGTLDPIQRWRIQIKIREEIRKKSGYDANRLFDLEREVEGYAESYARKMLARAERLGLLETPRFKEMPFFKAIRDKIIASTMRLYRERGFVKGANSSILAVFHMLRKAKLSRQYGVPIEYSLKELMEEIQRKTRIEIPRNIFKGFILSHTRPHLYVSAGGRRYPYFTRKQADEVAKLILDFFKGKGG